MTHHLKSPALTPSEKQVMIAIEAVLRLCGLCPLRLQSALVTTEDERRFRVGKPGLPDLCVPRFLVEVKKPGGKLSEIQKQKIDELERDWRVSTAVVDSPEQLILWLAEHPDL